MIHRVLAPAAVLILVTLGLTMPLKAEAQGRGRPKAPKRTAASSGTTSTQPTSTGTATTASSVGPLVTLPAPDPLAPVTTFRQFGSWLDDASAPIRGEGYTSIAVGHWLMSDTSQTNVPMIAAGIGVTDRVQVSATVPFYQVHLQDTTLRGVDDVYLSAKYTIVDPTLTLSEFGLAVSPVVEILSPGVTERRVHFALPVSVELRRLPVRVYASAGYFTRGSFFTGAALEWTSASGLALSGALTQSYSTRFDDVLDQLAIGRQRVDVSGTLAKLIGRATSASMSVGRSVTSIEEGGTRLALSGGIAIRFVASRQ